MAGMSGYHTSVIVDAKDCEVFFENRKCSAVLQEYFFDSIGILEAPPLASHQHPDPNESQV